MSDHIPRHRLEEMFAGGEEALDASSAAHLETCPDCAARASELRAARARSMESYRVAPPIDAVSGGTRERLAAQRVRRSRWFGAFAGGLAAAALLAFQLSGRVPGSIGFKGAFTFDVYVEQQGAPRRLSDGDIVTPGAKLAFAYRIAAPLHLTLLGIDGAGEVTRYFPRSDRGDPEPLRVGSYSQLPVGVQLDDQRGVECFVALFSERPLPEVDARHGLERAFDEARARGASFADMKPLDVPAKQVRVWLNKL